MGRRKRTVTEAAEPGGMAAEGVGSEPPTRILGRNAVLSVMVAAATPESSSMGRQSMELDEVDGDKVPGDLGLMGRMGLGGHGRRSESRGQFWSPAEESQSAYRRNRNYWLSMGGWRNRAGTRAFGEACEPKGGTIQTRQVNGGALGVPFSRRESGQGRESKVAEKHGDLGEDGGDSEPQVDEEEDGGESEIQKGSLNKALDLAKKPKELKKAKETFMRRFLAANTLAAKNSKRKKILEIAEAAGCGKVFPLSRDIITTVGAALDEAKIQSGDQYVNELKLMHIEDGHDWHAPLERQLFLVKKALQRHKGPEQRAKEVKPESLSGLVWEARCSKFRGHERPAWSYAFACIWMLRAAEAVKVKVKHLRLDHLTKTVSLVIPHSKMDQRGKGVTRTFTCMCWEGSCDRWCAWGCAIRCLAEHTDGDGEAPLFKGVVRGGKKSVSKAQMVRGWNRDVAPTITGHSARRSGAMRYTRAGLDITTIGFLGRWKSSAVLRYVEEAMSEMPANTRQEGRRTEAPEKGEDNPVRASNEEPILRDAHEVEKHVTVHEKVVKFVKDKEAIVIPADPEDEDMWAISSHSRGKVAHVVTKASWGLDLDSWQAHCGWHFAQRFVKVQLVRKPPKKTKVCQKCEQGLKLRDKVRGGCSVAQLMLSTLAHQTSD